MTAATDREQARRQAYADALRRVAELTERGVLPLPISATSLSFWFHEDREGRERAAVAAEALGVTWRADSPANADRYLRAVARIPAASLDLALYLDRGEVEAPRVTPAGVAFAAELNAAADGKQQARIAAAGPAITREQLAEVAPGLLRDDDYSPEALDRDTEGEGQA